MEIYINPSNRNQNTWKTEKREKSKSLRIEKNDFEITKGIILRIYN